MTTSASASSAVATMPSATMSPARRSESCSFIWHPKSECEFLWRCHLVSLLNEGRFRIGRVVGDAGPAITTQTMPMRSHGWMLWLSTMSPMAKATAGSSAKSTPAVDGFSRRSAWSSQAKPNTIAITATRARRPSVAGWVSTKCDEPIVIGNVNTAPIDIETASPRTPRPVPDPVRGEHVRGPPETGTGREEYALVVERGAGARDREHAESGKDHEGEVTRRALPERRHHERPRYSMATAAPGDPRDRLVEALVHERDRHAEGQSPQPLLLRPRAQVRSREGHQDDRAQEEAPRARRRWTDLSKDARDDRRRPLDQ